MEPIGHRLDSDKADIVSGVHRPKPKLRVIHKKMPVEANIPADVDGVGSKAPIHQGNRLLDQVPIQFGGVDE